MTAAARARSVSIGSIFGYSLASLAAGAQSVVRCDRVWTRRRRRPHYGSTAQLVYRVRGVRRHARPVRDRGPVLRVRGQTEHGQRLPVGRQAYVRVPDHHVADSQVGDLYSNIVFTGSGKSLPAKKATVVYYANRGSGIFYTYVNCVLDIFETNTIASRDIRDFQ